MKTRILATLVLLTLLLSACGKQVPSESSASDSSSFGSSSLTADFESSASSSLESSAAGSDSEASDTGTKPLSSEPTNPHTSPFSPPITAAPTTAVRPTERQTVTIVIPEGFSTMQIAARLESNGVCSKADFVNAAQSYAIKSFSVPQSSNRCFRYEGYLYPDTYTFYINDKPVDVLKKMLNNYAARSGMPSDDTLILASIIEKEVRSDEQMTLVSSVLHNRLKSGMKLQCDPTREYVNKYITGNPLVTNPEKFAALYNTYKCPALPAGPICNPGLRAIKAAKNPADSNYLYFFFGNDNQNHYAETLEEHEEQKKQFGVQFS